MANLTEKQKLKKIARNEYMRQYMKVYRENYPEKGIESREKFNENHPGYYNKYKKHNKPIYQDQKSDPGQKQGEDQTA